MGLNERLVVGLLRLSTQQIESTVLVGATITSLHASSPLYCAWWLVASDSDYYCIVPMTSSPLPHLRTNRSDIIPSIYLQYYYQYLLPPECVRTSRRELLRDDNWEKRRQYLQSQQLKETKKRLFFFVARPRARVVNEEQLCALKNRRYRQSIVMYVLQTHIHTRGLVISTVLVQEYQYGVCRVLRHACVEIASYIYIGCRYVGGQMSGRAGRGVSSCVAVRACASCACGLLLQLSRASPPPAAQACCSREEEPPAYRQAGLQVSNSHSLQRARSLPMYRCGQSAAIVEIRPCSHQSDIGT